MCAAVIFWSWKKPRVITAGRSSCSCKRHISPRPLRPAIAETLAKLRAEKRGLSDVEVQARLTTYGPNALVGKRRARLPRYSSSAYGDHAGTVVGNHRFRVGLQ